MTFRWSNSSPIEVAVMQDGRIIETNCAEELYRPKEPYTKELLDAVPKADLEASEREATIELVESFDFNAYL